MKIISNDKKIKRYGRIGSYLTIGSLVILLGGLVLSFLGPAQYISFSFIALLAGFILSQVGIFLGNRYGRKPRPDKSITAALKGLEDKYSLYHYMTPVSHLLVGPAGVWVLLPFHQGGTITYNENKQRYHQKGGNLYLKLFAQENLGRPDLEAVANTTDLVRFLTKALPENGLPEVNAVLLFLNEKATVDADNAPTPAIPIKKLKEFIRRKAREAPMPLDKVNTIQAALPRDTLTL